MALSDNGLCSPFLLCFLASKWNLGRHPQPAARSTAAQIILREKRETLLPSDFSRTLFFQREIFLFYNRRGTNTARDGRRRQAMKIAFPCLFFSREVSGIVAAFKQHQMFIEETSLSPHVRVCFIFRPLSSRLICSAADFYGGELPPSRPASAALASPATAKEAAGSVSAAAAAAPPS